MRVQVKRLKSVANKNPTDMDDGYVNALLMETPTIGDSLHIELFSDRWVTSLVTKVKFIAGAMDVYTNNSVYRFKVGWKEN